MIIGRAINLTTTSPSAGSEVCARAYESSRCVSSAFLPRWRALNATLIVPCQPRIIRGKWNRKNRGPGSRSEHPSRTNTTRIVLALSPAVPSAARIRERSWSQFLAALPRLTSSRNRYQPAAKITINGVTPSMAFRIYRVPRFIRSSYFATDISNANLSIA